MYIYIYIFIYVCIDGSAPLRGLTRRAQRSGKPDAVGAVLDGPKHSVNKNNILTTTSKLNRVAHVVASSGGEGRRPTLDEA